ncbi:redox-regulated ATPase YchF [Candidatus Deianiraea vastatrix]|uniref:Ribosome-binding ATPase YchF n=1 Tax=Candidatus Deianiraea vastatrix TaxID=2163644 RepID=A0A5B8XEX7_9RICK|nr:redox-regulated ATPase YchF [Candidatus Deianiraea vastatrix]QED22891.1 Ribosome/GTP binding ATPase YchF [Candidatus Deianiraea vastatrix]
MPLNCGIVGLPNVGKSTLFNAITNTSNAQAANYPFCTIEPNSGIVPVGDERLEKLAKIAGSEKIIPNTIEIIDIAGLVKGASKGEGLGNQFLGNIRQVDAILHVVRCFEDDDIIHVDGNVDPLRDIEVIETELLLADIAVLEKRADNLQKKMKTQKDAGLELEIAKKLINAMNNGTMASNVSLSNDEIQIAKTFQLITQKPVIYIINTDEKGLKNTNKYAQSVMEFAKKRNINTVTICAKVEAELSEFEGEDKKTMLAELGLTSSGLEKIARSAFDILDLITFFTIGPKEAHAWSIKRGGSAPNAAGVIHTDFEKGFIKAEVISYNDYVTLGGEAGAKQAGKFRLEGKEYLICDGDIVHFKFNV